MKETCTLQQYLNVFRESKIDLKVQRDSYITYWHFKWPTLNLSNDISLKLQQKSLFRILWSGHALQFINSSKAWQTQRLWLKFMSIQHKVQEKKGFCLTKSSSKDLTRTNANAIVRFLCTAPTFTLQEFPAHCHRY